MSEARQGRTTPREVPNVDSVASRLASWANVFVGETTGFPFPMSPTYTEGHRINAREARVLNSTKYARAKSVANSALTRGAQKDLSDAEKVAWLTKYVAEYEFTDALGSEWSENVLTFATSRVVFKRGVEQGKRKGEYADYLGTPEHAKDMPVVAKILSDPALADRYVPLIEAEIAAIFAERHEIAKRASKNGVEAEEVEL
jgi:hypothetical protein